MKETTLTGFLDLGSYRPPTPAKSKYNYCKRCGSGQYVRRLTISTLMLVCEDIHGCHVRMMKGKLRLIAGGAGA